MKRLCKQIWMILTLDCEDSARLTSESLDRPLNWAEAWAVKMHRVVCSKSRRLNRQLIQLHAAMQSVVNEPASSQAAAVESEAGHATTVVSGLPADVRTRISTRLRDLKNDDPTSR